MESSRLGVGLKVTLKISETHSHWQHQVITVEEVGAGMGNGLYSAVSMEDGLVC